MIHTIDNPKEVTYFTNPEEKNFTGVVKDEVGYIVYYVDGKIHREDGPALIYENGYLAYYLNDKYLNISTDQELKDYLILRMFE